MENSLKRYNDSRGCDYFQENMLDGMLNYWCKRLHCKLEGPADTLCTECQRKLDIRGAIQAKLPF